MAKTTAPASRFSGFTSPHYTQVLDELFNALMVTLSGAELKVLLHIIRHTLGFKRNSDTISLSQMLGGLTASDGRQLDQGVGLTKKPLLAALRSLQERGVILTERRTSTERGNEPTSYRLHIISAEHKRQRERKETPPPWGEKVHQALGGETPPHKKQDRERQIFRIFERLRPRFRTKRLRQASRQCHHAPPPRPQAQHHHPPVAVHRRQSRRP